MSENDLLWTAEVPFPQNRCIWEGAYSSAVIMHVSTLTVVFSGTYHKQYYNINCAK